MHRWLRRALVALLVGVVSPASASRLANVGPPASSAAAEIWGSASGILTSIPAERAELCEAQRLEVPRGIRCLYDQSASDISNDPINHRDPTGRKINVGKVEPDDLLELLAQVSGVTGLSVGVCSPDEIATGLCEADELVARGSAAGGSAIARNILLDAIDDPSVIQVESHNKTNVGFGSHWPELNYPGDGPKKSRTRYSQLNGKKGLPTNFAAGRFGIDFQDFRHRRAKNSTLLDSLSVGLVFMHELLHHVTTGSHPDDSDLGIEYTTLGDPKKRWPKRPGDIESIVNDIRGQLLLPKRLNYFEVDGAPGEACLEFEGGNICYNSNDVDQ